MTSLQRHHHSVIDDKSSSSQSFPHSSPPPSPEDNITTTPFTTTVAPVPPVAIVPDYPPVSTVSVVDTSPCDSDSERLTNNTSGLPKKQVSSEELTTSRGPIRKRKDHEGQTTNDGPSKVSSAEQYTDYSRVPVEDLRDPSAFIFAAASAKEPPFPVKLHRILCNPEFQDIIAWLPHGRSWRVLKPKAFEERVIPLHFRHCRYSSFMRQVNGWGFKRVFQGADLNSYYHELFLRGMPHLCLKMRRPTGKQVQKTAAEAAKMPAPDFYSISEKYPLPEYTCAPQGSPSDQQKDESSSQVLQVEDENVVAKDVRETDMQNVGRLPEQVRTGNGVDTEKDESAVASALQEIQTRLSGRDQQLSMLAAHQRHNAPVVHQPGSPQDLLGVATARYAQLDALQQLQQSLGRQQPQAPLLASVLGNSLAPSGSPSDVDKLRQALAMTQLQNQLLIGALSGSVGSASTAPLSANSQPSDLRQLAGLGGLGALIQQQQQIPQLRQLQLLRQQQLGGQGPFF